MSPVPSQRLPRRCRVLVGERAQAHAWLAQALRDVPDGQLLWIGKQAIPGCHAVPQSQVQRCLGGECDVLVFDAHDGLHPDAFAAVLGTLAGGGELLLLVPAWEQWAASGDPLGERLAPYPLDVDAVGNRFLARLQAQFELDACVRVVRLADPGPSGKIEPLQHSTGLQLNDDQRAVVDALRRVAEGHANRPLVITADRGRGKSTALGAALAGLLRERSRQVLLLAPSAVAVEALFAQLQRELPQGVRHANTFELGGGRVWLRLPDQQLEDPQACDLLVIDEAAAIALGMLQQLLQRHNRVVFSSTVHGYEGSGRGFVLKFNRVLDRLCPQWQALQLRIPVRWSQDDPLEHLLNRVLLLDAEPSLPGAAEPAYRWIDQAELGEDESLLRGLFALLVSAHYQTRPCDLQQLLDAPGLRILAALQDGTPVGVALLVEEGGFDPQMAAAVCDGSRRPRGHMLVQSLIQHAGQCELGGLRLWRVMRIAVLGETRRRGIGSRLLELAQRSARDRGVDLLGTAFALDAQLLPFWRKAGFETVRLGERRDSSSGMHSVQMLLGLNARSSVLQKSAAARFREQFPWRLAGSFRALPATLALPLLHGRDCADLPLRQADKSDVQAFALQRRGFADAAPALWRWLVCRLAAGAVEADSQQAELLIVAVLQHASQQAIARRTGIEGRRPQLAALRTAVKNLFEGG